MVMTLRSTRCEEDMQRLTLNQRDIQCQRHIQLTKTTKLGQIDFCVRKVQYTKTEVSSQKI